MCFSRQPLTIDKINSTWDVYYENYIIGSSFDIQIWRYALCKLHVIYYCSNVWSKLASKNALGPIYMEGGSRDSPEDTNVIFQPTLVHWNMCLYFKFELCTQRWHVPSQNHEPSWEKLRFARSLYQNLFLFGQLFLPRHGTTMTWHHAKFHDFKTKFLNVLYRATMPRCLNLILMFCMGPTPFFHLYRA